MKKYLSLFIAFVITCVFGGVVSYAVGHIFDWPFLYEDGAAVYMGICIGLGGTFGPILYDVFAKKFLNK